MTFIVQHGRLFDRIFFSCLNTVANSVHVIFAWHTGVAVYDSRVKGSKVKVSEQERG